MNCPVCDCQNVHPLIVDPKLILRCARCRIEWVSPLPTAEESAAYYGPVGGQATGGDERIRLLTAAERVRRFRNLLFQGARILDIGAGCGELLHILEHLEPTMNLNLAGIEPGEKAVELCRTRFSLDGVIRANIFGFEASQPYDIVTLIHVLEHLPDPLAAFRAIKRLMHQGSKLVIEVPNSALGLVRLPLGMTITLPGYKHPEHLFFFKPVSLRSLLHRVGMEIERLYTYSVGHPILDGIAVKLPTPLFQLYRRLFSGALWPLDRRGYGLVVFCVASLAKL